MIKCIFTIIGCRCICVVLGQDTIPSKKIAADSAQFSILQEVVLSASRMREQLLKSPISIRKENEKYFLASPAPSFFDALENIQGVQMITPSLGFKVINARGFANTINVRFAQLSDGMDMPSPHIGGPIGNALGPSDLDIDNVEIIPGVASALYGMNTINGMANFTTKNPFRSAGFSIQQKTGVTHLADSNSAARICSETNIRLAKVISPKFALKMNGSFIKIYLNHKTHVEF